MFNSRSNPLGYIGFREVILPGAFNRTLQENKIDVKALFNHNPDHLLGTRASGTLRLSQDDKGLAIEIDPPDTQMGRDLITLMKRGDIRGMSFAFDNAKDEWSKEDGVRIRTIRDMDLYDVSPVTNPAYPMTDVSCRSLDAIIEKEARDYLNLMRLRLAERLQ